MKGLVLKYTTVTLLGNNFPGIMKGLNVYYMSVLLVINFSCYQSPEGDVRYQKALENGKLANEGFRRCIHYRDAWLTYADSTTGLIPRNLANGIDIWNAQDAAADNYPFMVLTSAILDHELYQGLMLDILNTEKDLTSRVNTLPDTWSFSKNYFWNDTINMDQIIFGSSEYIKDGLLPLMEYLGKTPWTERMLEMLDDLNNEVDVVTTIQGKFGRAPLDEVNGELLQVLSRVYWLTSENKYLDWAYKIGDFYLSDENLPTNQEYLRLRDHGCEIISGLCELYIATSFADEVKKQEYRPPLYQMLDRILEVGRNDRGMFFNAINPVTGKVIEEQIADTWGYTLNGYYAVYLIDGTERYKDAVFEALENIHYYKNHPWEGESADGYADAIESALNLHNRVPSDPVARWIDSETGVMWKKQQESGIIEGWHGDGNFARTTLMYCLWKTQGITIDPWREDVVFGAVLQEQSLQFVIQANEPWQGKIRFDFPRHQAVLHLPLDYPRINQFPEWFTVVESEKYVFRDVSDKMELSYNGRDLVKGIELKIDPGKTYDFELKKY
jgi:hypothetical protein